MNRFKPIYEDDHLLAISKPRGILTVGNKPRQKNLLDEVKKEYIKRNIRLRPLNRLDRDTSGIVLFAKTKECYEEAVEKKKFSGTTKTYIALIKGIPQQKSGVITFPLPSRQDKRKMLPSETKYKILETYSFRSGAASAVEVEISSGRFHQIRRHFSMIHHPLLMDREYMDKKDFKYYGKILPFWHYFLHAEKIRLNHFVTGQPLTITSPMTREFKRAIAAFT